MLAQVVVAINRFHTDTDDEIALVAKIAKQGGAFDAVEATHFAHGGAGAAALGKAVMAACATAAPTRDFKFLYDAKSQGIKSKVRHTPPQHLVGPMQRRTVTPPPSGATWHPFSSP